MKISNKYSYYIAWEPNPQFSVNPHSDAVKGCDTLVGAFEHFLGAHCCKTATGSQDIDQRMNV